MDEYTIHVESPRTDVTGSVLDRAQAYLTETDPEAGAACLVDYEKGTLSATMQVKAPTAGAALDHAIELFYGALDAAGFNVDIPGWRLNLELEAPHPQEQVA